MDTVKDVPGMDGRQTGADRVRQLEHALDGIYEISRVLTSTANLEAAMASVTHSLGNYLALQHGILVLFDEDGHLHLTSGFQGLGPNGQDYLDRVAQPIINRIIASRMPVLITDSANDPLFDNLIFDATGRRSAFIGVPILDRDKCTGAIVAEQIATTEDTPAAFDAEINFLIMVANLVGQTLRLQKMVIKDRERQAEEGRQVQKDWHAAPPLSTPVGAAGIVGRSPAIQEVLRKINIVARSHLPVLLRGESGTGKELFAQAIHDLSPRRAGPMIKVNCAALPESMLESELFGHEKGAFTGALNLRKGRFELADGGTLFLDEIGEISPAFQAKLLRVLQQGEFERVGGISTLKVDVRLVAATNRNLEEAVSKGDFRADLYFRICVIPIVLAPLRERADDVQILAREFLNRFNILHGTELTFSEDAMKVLRTCSFPGNIRELESCVNRTAAFARHDHLDSGDFACHNDGCLSSLLWQGKQGALGGCAQTVKTGPPTIQPALPEAGAATRENADSELPPEEHRHDHLEDEDLELPETSGGSVVEYQRLMEAMNKAGWVQAKAARLLGLSSRQLSYALRKHGIEVKKF